MGKFVKGQIANPNGSDGGRGRLQKQLAEKLSESVDEAVKLVKRCLKSEDPNLCKWAADTVFNRVYGKPKESVEHSGEINTPKQAFIALMPAPITRLEIEEETVQ
jgi:hypothetical protein